MVLHCYLIFLIKSAQKYASRRLTQTMTKNIAVYIILPIIHVLYS